MRTRLSQDAWVVICLMLFLLLFSAFAVKKQTTTGGIEMMPRRTSYSASRYGVKALYETLDDLHYRVRRQTQPLTTEPDDGVLFIFAPETSISDEEWHDVYRWLEKGNILVIADDYGFDYEPAKKQATVKSSPCAPSFLTADIGSYRTEKNAEIAQRTWVFSTESIPGIPFGPHAEKSTSVAPSDAVAVPLVPLFRRNTATTVSFGRCGKGGVIVLGSAWSVSNDGIASDDNLALLLNALNHRGPAGKIAVTFDEFHHGYGKTPGIGSLIGPSARMGMVQLCMAFVLMLFAVSRRFGKPIYLREGARYRSEYLSSMSSLLMKAHALDVVCRELDQKFRDDMCHWLGLPPDAGADAVLTATEHKRPDKASDMRALIRAGNATDEKSVLALQAKRDQLRKELMNLK